MNLEEEVGEILRERDFTLATAESCTGGLIGHRITNVPGSSDYFERGLVTYSNASKMELLGVSGVTLEREGAVSEATALAMAEGVRSASRTTLGLSVTGIAGPSGGSGLKPVGTVFIALSGPWGSRWRRFNFKGTRREIKAQTAEAALAMLRDYLRESGGRA